MASIDDILTLGDAATLLGIAPVTLRAAVARGRLKARKFGGTWLTTKQDVEAYRRDHLGQVGRPKGG